VVVTDLACMLISKTFLLNNA